MKQAIVFLMVVVGLVGSSTGARAQLLKTLANSFTKGLTSKQGNSANTGSKADSAAQASKDSAMMAAYLSGASKPGGMMGGPGHVSAADSASAAAAAKQFMTASGGSGMLYQYQTRYDIRIKAHDSVLVDTMMTAVSDSRFTHADIDILGVKMTVLGRPGQTGQRKYSAILYPQARKYKMNVIDTARLNSANGQTYQVTKMGTETVAGYSCVHARLTISGANKKTIITEDIWTSTAVPGYMQLKQDMSNSHVTVKMMEALQQAGCDGFAVKVSGASEQMTFQMVLMTAERKNFPASMFVIPAGYTAM